MGQSSAEDRNVLQNLQLQRDSILTDGDIGLTERMYILNQMWWRWADFHLYILSPLATSVQDPQVLTAQTIPETEETEFVYPIIDYGDHYSTSKAMDAMSSGMSMWRLYCTIEKIIGLLVGRLIEKNIAPETEIQVAFGGYELAQRKGFESIINLSYNVVVSNFDPDANEKWGTRYLQNVKNLAEKGYGYPPAAPRTPYRRGGTGSKGPRRS